MTIQLGAPSKFMRGATVQWRVASGTYDPASFLLRVGFATANDIQTVIATNNGDDSWLVSLDATASLAFQEANYRYQEIITDGTNTHLVGRGVIQVLPNFLETSGGHDGRTHAAIMWDKINALLEDKANTDQLSMSQQDMSLSRYQWEDLIEQRGHYAHQMTDEERIARGYKPRRIKTPRFVRL